MLPIERRNHILGEIRKTGSVSVTSLGKALNVSEETIRRDLKVMEDQALLCRVFGGAYLSNRVNQEVPINLRRDTYREGKEAIASLCLPYINDGDTIMLDASSTALRIAMKLKGVKRISVITNSMDIARELSNENGIELILCGGFLDKQSQSFRSIATLDELERLSADKAFVSCTGLSLERNITDGNEVQAHIRAAMFNNSNKKYLIADMTKFGKTTMNRIIELANVDAIFTDTAPSKEWNSYFSQNAIECHYPDE